MSCSLHYLQDDCKSRFQCPFFYSIVVGTPVHPSRKPTKIERSPRQVSDCYDLMTISLLKSECMDQIEERAEILLINVLNLISLIPLLKLNYLGRRRFVFVCLA